MVADYSFFTHGDASSPLTKRPTRSETAVVLWTPKLGSGRQTRPQEDSDEGEDTDLLCLQHLSIQYPPLEPTRIFPIQSATIPHDLPLVRIGQTFTMPRPSYRDHTGRSAYGPSQPIEDDFLSFKDYDDEDGLDHEDEEQEYGSNEGYEQEEQYTNDAGRRGDDPYPHLIQEEEEEEYVNNGWSVAQQPYFHDGRENEVQANADHRSYESEEDTYLDPRSQTYHQGEDYIDHRMYALVSYRPHPDTLTNQPSHSPDSSPSYSPARDGPSPSQAQRPYPTELDLRYPLHSSSPDHFPYSGTMCEPTSSPRVQTSDAVIEPDSPEYDQWLDPPPYDMKRKTREDEDTDDEDEWYDVPRREKRPRLEVASERQLTPSPSPAIEEMPEVDQPDLATPPASMLEHQSSPKEDSQQHDSSESSGDSQQGRGSRKRALESDAIEATERTLKRPFRAPAPKIVLAKATARRHSVSPPSASSVRPALGMKTLLSKSAPADRKTENSRKTQTPPTLNQTPQAFFDSINTKRAVPKTTSRKAFKPPLLAPLPRKSNDNDPTRPLQVESINSVVNKLEKEARTLRQAVKYLTDISEDDRLADLIRQWRTAGRDVVEQMYDRVPRPDPTTESRQQGGSSWFHTSGNGGGGGLTDEQERWLSQCAKNEDGEPVDDEGNVLFQQTGDLMQMVEEGCRGRAGESDEYIPTYKNGIIGARSNVNPAQKEWNMGTMMLRFSVDPALLGWDDDQEDWGEADE